jgi:mannose-1-phosphate guanylyltransferase
MQRTRKAYVIKCEFLWDDIGTFAALGRFLKSVRGNNISGNTFLNSSQNCIVFGKDRLIIAFGIKDVIIVDTGDVLLVMDKNKDQEVKYLVNLLSEDGFEKYL